MKKKYLIFGLFFILGIGSVIFYFFTSKVNELFQANAKDFIFNEEYSGIVTQKYIDKEQHNYKTLIILDDTIQHTILFDFVMEGLYEFIEVGDTLSKKSGTLDLRLKRKNLDTLITMKIFDRRKMSRSENE